MLRVNYKLQLDFLNGPVAVRQPGLSQLEVALRRRYDTRVYRGDVSHLIDLRYSFDFMIEGPRPTPEDLARMENILCEVWMTNSSMLAVHVYKLK